MAASSSSIPVAVERWVGGRYRVLGELGRGGMASVYRVHDRSLDREVALKQVRLPDQEVTAKYVSELFVQEFHTLAQLAHPRIVEVLDFGTADDGDYYTMELLGGGDLRSRCPLPWREVCRVIRDVCSALSLLHSRRFVHRDLTPGNIFCTDDGTAKLIDLGAMARVGPCKQIAGTPAYVAPEAVTGLMVDARTDLFALGATAYYALTGRNAYRARSLAMLRDAWRSPPAPPSTHAPDVPPELDALVMSLLHLTPLARPGSAAEVMDRVTAIASIPADEQLLVRQAYLATPQVVGREDSLLKIRKLILRAARGDGGATVVTGDVGVGRSRLLDASVLEGKLLGAVVLRADAGDATAPWGAACALGRQLLQALPDVAGRLAEPHAPVLGHVMPELAPDTFHEDAEGPDAAAAAMPMLATFSGPQDRRARVSEAFRDWLLTVADLRCLILVVDDLDRLDDASATLVAWLGGLAKGRRVVVLASALKDAADGADAAVEAAARLREAGATLRLRNLSAEESQRLLASVFGEAPHLALLASRIFRVAAGNPATTMQLAQHLLDQGTVRYEAGGWILPDEVSGLELPSSLRDAMRARLSRVSPVGMDIARCLALADVPSFHFDECVAVGGDGTVGGTVEALGQLAAVGVVAGDGREHGLTQPAWREILMDGLDDAVARPLHLRLAALLERRGGERFRVAQHLLLGGERERALDVMYEHLVTTRLGTAQSPADAYDLVDNLPAGWLQTLNALVDACRELGRPRSQCFELMYGRLTYMTTKVHPLAGGEHEELLDALRHAVGLDILATLDPALTPMERLQIALGRAQERYDATPEHERVATPGQALVLLSRMMVLIIGIAGRSFDRAMLLAAPSLEPLAPLSPAIAAVEKNRQNTLHLLAGRTVEARRGYRELIERLDQPDRAGLDPTSHEPMHCAMMYAMGTVEASAGIEEALDWAARIEHSPLFEVNAWRLRALHALRQGDADRAEEMTRQLELLRMRNRPPQIFEGSHVWTVALSHAAAEDLVRIKHVMVGLEEMATRFPNWRPCLHFACGVYQRLRGDYAQAEHELEQALSLCEPGEHVGWAVMAGAYVTALLDQQRVEDACDRGYAYLALADEHGLSALRYNLTQPLALAEAVRGRYDEAVALADSAIELHRELGASGVPVGYAHETRARVALAMGDRETFTQHAELCAASYRAGRNPVLTAKYERLMRDARRADLAVSDALSAAADITMIGEERRLSTMLATILGECQGMAQRAERALGLLIDESGGCAAGYLYVLKPEGPELVASVGNAEPPKHMDTAVADLVDVELGQDGEATTTSPPAASEDDDVTGIAAAWTGIAGDQFVPLMLSHPTPTGHALTGVVVLAVDDLPKFAPPNALLRAISESLFAAGDAVTRILA